MSILAPILPLISSQSVQCVSQDFRYPCKNICLSNQCVGNGSPKFFKSNYKPFPFFKSKLHKKVYAFLFNRCAYKIGNESLIFPWTKIHMQSSYSSTEKNNFSNTNIIGRVTIPSGQSQSWLRMAVTAENFLLKKGHFIHLYQKFIHIEFHYVIYIIILYWVSSSNGINLYVSYPIFHLQWLCTSNFS